MLDNKWLLIVSRIKFKFKPIVNIYTGSTLIIEIKREYQNSDFKLLKKLIESSENQPLLFEIELRIFKNALEEFRKICFYEEFYKNIKILFNFENNIFQCNVFNPEKIFNIINSLNLNSHLYVMISTNSYLDSNLQNNCLMLIKKYGIKIGIDNFGSGFADIKAMYRLEPDFIRIDNFFINQIEQNHKKKLIIANLINTIHTLGIKVIADNISSKKEFYICKDLCFDLAGGELISGFINSIKDISEKYEIVNNLILKDKRKKDELIDKKLIKSETTNIEPISIESHIIEIFNSFRRNRDRTFLPVVDKNYDAIGLIREKDLKDYVYSLYGKELLLNRSIGKSLKDFTSKCSIVDVNTGIEEILEIFSNDYSSEGIIITKESKYLGFLTAKSLIKILNEKNLNIARNQNPLSKLPGNNIISNYLNEILKNNEVATVVYFDFDNFKPYNDIYGFRQGDRMILLFSELLQKNLLSYNSFIGHIGGDDFFAGLKGLSFEKAVEIIKSVALKFKRNAENFYNDKDKKNRYITSKDREGNVKIFDLITVSSVIVHIDTKESFSIENISHIIANFKKEAKKSPDKVATIELKKYKKLKIKNDKREQK